jgi:hypothetical protein
MSVGEWVLSCWLLDIVKDESLDIVVHVLLVNVLGLNV